ncbi:MAG: leucine-rich repeat domain-containing protein [Clostridia bacterium]|nr:leucine-rich repeat domain-containing protein [Clostridia bacterium]MBQ7907781.1 leucine-rich repeat domain-containing protein [Clostridia bacterium]
MKAKFILFLTLTLALLSIFAVSVSAEVPEWTAMQYLDGMADKATFGEDGTSAATSRVMLSHEVTDETTGETTIVYTTYPAYYICKDSTSLTMTYTEINEYAGVTYAAANVVRLEIPKGTVTLPDEVLRASKGYTALQTVVIPEGVTTIGGFVFKVKDNETNTSLISVDIPSTVTSIGEDAFYRCLYLTKLIIPEGVTTIPGQMAYYAGSITELIFHQQ